MRSKILIALVLLSAAFAADLPRKAPEFAVQLPDGTQALVSSYRGKVLCLAFILTTWPHCQKTTQVLSGIQKDLGPKGFEVLEGALNTDANLQLFKRQFLPPFPVGMANQMDALQFMQISLVVRTFVPYIAFIDRKGIIRAQFTGGDLTDDSLEKVLRENAEKLVNEPSRPAKPKAKP
jgi:Redoxin